MLCRRISPPSGPSWAFIRCFGGVHDGDVEAVVLQAAGRLETEQPAADDHGAVVVVVRGVLDHRAGVVDGPEGEDAGQRRAVGERAAPPSAA